MHHGHPAPTPDINSNQDEFDERMLLADQILTLRKKGYPSETQGYVQPTDPKKQYKGYVNRGYVPGSKDNHRNIGGHETSPKQSSQANQPVHKSPNITPFKKTKKFVGK